MSLMIVWHHAYNVDVYDLANQENVFSKVLYVLQRYFSTIQLVAVPSFLVLSGYLFFRNYSLKTVFEKYKTRFFSLVIPYLSWNTISFIFFYGMTHIPAIAVRMNMETVQLSLFSLYRNIIWGDQNTAMWFLRTLIVLVALSPIIYLVIKKNKIFAWGSVILSICIYIIFPIGQHTALFASAFFIFGGVLGIYYPNLVFCDVAGREGVVCFICFLTINVFFTVWGLVDIARLRTVLLFLDILVFWLAIRSVAFFQSEQDMPWFFHIGFFIFSMHGIVLESTEKVIFILLGKTVFGAYIDYLFAPILTLVIIILTAWILNSRCKPVWIILNGGRK